mmetsp:Transcript_1447/g.2362  ORF Transcript_1447/g.2362 Transcript_1447/m.2362 type:complete len:256 (+) Transcript_1447:420-1187(+)
MSECPMDFAVFFNAVGEEDCGSDGDFDEECFVRISNSFTASISTAIMSSYRTPKYSWLSPSPPPPPLPPPYFSPTTSPLLASCERGFEVVVVVAMEVEAEASVCCCCCGDLPIGVCLTASGRTRCTSCARNPTLRACASFLLLLLLSVGCNRSPPPPPPPAPPPSSSDTAAAAAAGSGEEYEEAVLLVDEESTLPLRVSIGFLVVAAATLEAEAGPAVAHASSAHRNVTPLTARTISRAFCSTLMFVLSRTSDVV